MNSGKALCLIFAVFILAQLVYASPLMTSDQLSEYNDTQGKANREKVNACAKQCIKDKVPEGRMPTINESNVCWLDCSSDPCTKPCRAECSAKGTSTMDCIGDCESRCNKPKREACDAECNGYENAFSNWYELRCVCVCNSGFVPGKNACVEEGTGGGNGDTVECGKDYELIDGECVLVRDRSASFFDFSGRFRDGMLNRVSHEYGMSQFMIDKIKNFTGMDIREFEAGMGNGKTAYVIKSDDLSAREALSVGTKANLMIAFYKGLGYNVKFIDRQDMDTVMNAMADPNAGAVAYFGHTEKSIPAIENQGGDDISIHLAKARARWYMKQGMTQLEATKKANAEAQIPQLDIYYGHTCYSADPGFENLADQVVKPGGLYVGEQGLLWSVETPDIQYRRGGQ
ncbi:MAG: hypothetical protein ABH854_05320 [Candidatus Diapherotrites archaeon]|nr:hypothetical protein [Candidatus Micrarchaeota archaeon]MBU1939886.1 hypothetical protein [Candidatus Micrarchaeota archaeon]